MSEIVFTTKNEGRYVRHGNVTVAALVAQATGEFGEINVLDTTEGDAVDTTTAGHISVLQSTLKNTQVVFDQLESLDDDYPMKDAKLHVLSAMAAIDAELEKLNG